MSSRLGETPYRKYRQYYRDYYRQYRRTHESYRIRQNELQRKRYREFRKQLIRRAGEYIRSIYDNWYGAVNKDLFGREIALAAERIAIERILPKEGFRDILWTQTFKSNKSSTTTAGSFWMFDAFAVRDGKKFAIQITTSPYRQIRNRDAVSAFLTFFGLTLCVCAVNPDMKRYYLAEYPPDGVPHTVMMTPARVKRLKRI